MPVFVEDKVNLRSDLRTNFPEFQTFILVTPTVVMVPDGYSQALYDYLNLNCVVVPDPRTPEVLELVLGSIEGGDFAGQRAYSPAHDLWFTWTPDAGASGEWWGEVKQTSWGSSGNTGNGGPFRLVGSLTTSGTRGFPIQSRIRCTQVSGKWDNTETGTVDIRRNGVSQFQIAISSANSVNELLDRTSATYVIETLSGDPVAPSTDTNNLQFYWINSISGSMRNSQFTMYFSNILVSGD